MVLLTEFVVLEKIYLHNQSIQATGRGSGALTRQAHWPAPDFGRYAEGRNHESFHRYGFSPRRDGAG